MNLDGYASKQEMFFMSDEVCEIPVMKIYLVNCTESIAANIVHKLLCYHAD